MANLLSARQLASIILLRARTKLAHCRTLAGLLVCWSAGLLVCWSAGRWSLVAGRWPLAA
jgi:hypothetical protein